MGKIAQMAKMNKGVRKAYLKNKQRESWRRADLEQDKHAQGAKGLKSSAIYARQSSGTWTHGRKRQFDAATSALHQYFGVSRGQGVKGLKSPKKISEIKSGSLPLDKRKVLMDLLDDPAVQTIGVENLRAISRKMVYGEMIYEKMKEKGKRIVAKDMPDIFHPNPHPQQAYARRSVLNAQEYERDSIFYRTSNALQDKYLEELKKGDRMRVTQEGECKINGRKSLLEECKPSAALRKKLATQCRARAKGKFGWRLLAVKLSKMLKLKTIMTHETARRTSSVLLG